MYGNVSATEPADPLALLLVMEVHLVSISFVNEYAWGEGFISGVSEGKSEPVWGFFQRHHKVTSHDFAVW